MTREQVIFVGDMVVERHRLDDERLAEVAHAQFDHAVLVGKSQRGLQHAVSA